MVFMILFKKTAYTDGLVNLMINWFGGKSVDFIDGPYWAKMFVMCFYTIWVVLPFKILILTSALASVNPEYYKAARVDGTSSRRICPDRSSKKMSDSDRRIWAFLQKRSGSG